MDDAFIHPSAVIDRPCSIGARTKIWHFAHVMSGATIGRDCVLGHSVFVGGAARIGDRVRVQNHVSIFDGIELEDDVFCGPSCVFTNVKNPRATLSQKMRLTKTIVRCGATIGANATIVCGSKIGQYAFVAAGAVVTRPVLDFALVVGAPARFVGWVGHRGARLMQESANGFRCPDTGRRYAVVDGGLSSVDEPPDH